MCVIGVTDGEAVCIQDTAMRRGMRRTVSRRELKLDEVEAQRRQVSIDFVRIELELADTFCKLALESHSPERKQQFEVNAHRALQAALHALTRLHLNEKEVEGIVTQIEEVKAMLEALEGNGASQARC
jgi:hypothetical protein